jgi:hypothetical protein
MAKLSDRVDRLESLLGQFIVNTDVALRRLEASLEAFKEEMNEDRKKMYKMWGELANKMGTLVEDIVAPNIPRIAKEYFGAEELDFLGVRIRKRNVKDRSKKREFDVIAMWNDDEIVKYLTKKKIYAMALRDDTMDLLNFEKIKK